MEFKARILGTLILFLLLLLLLAVPCISRGRLHVKSMESSEVYDIDYRGPETHTYIPPPNRVGDRPKVHHKTSLARHRSKLHKSKRNGKKNLG